MPIGAEGSTLASQQLATDLLADYVEHAERILRAGGTDFSSLQKLIDDRTFADATSGNPVAPPGAVILSAVLVLGAFGKARGRAMAYDIREAKKWISGGADMVRVWTPH